MREWPKAKMLDSGRRVHSRMPCDRSLDQDSFERRISTLTKLMSVNGVPRYLRSENGPEFVSTALLAWAKQGCIEMAFIEPGKPWENGLNESFNGKFRDECLSSEWIRSRAEAKVVIEDWRFQYNVDKASFCPELLHADARAQCAKEKFGFVLPIGG